MKNILITAMIALAFFLLPAAGSAAGTDWGKKNPNAPKEVSQLDFIIGQWKLRTLFKTKNGSYFERRADLTAKYIMDGYGIMVEERHPGKTDYYTHAVYSYDTKSKKWEGASVNTLGNRKHLDGEFKDGKLVFIQEGELFMGRKGKNRVTFHSMSGDRYSVSFDTFSEKTGKWNKAGYKYEAVRLNGPKMNLQFKTAEELKEAKKFTVVSEVKKEPLSVYILDLSNQSFTTLPAEIATLKNLQHLGLSNVPLSSLPEETGQLTKLQELVLQHLDTPNLNLKTLPDSIKQLKYLEYINLIGNPNLDFPRVFKNLSHCILLNNLAIMNNNLTKLPEEITGLKSLEMVWMGKNPQLDLTDTVKKLAQLPMLKRIGFGSNYYKALPKEIKALRTLETIWLNKNAFETFPDLSGLVNLKGATLSNCGIKKVPSDLKAVPNLVTLDLSGNPGINTAELFGYLKKLPKLEKLALSRMGFKGLPKGIKQLKSLKALYLNGSSFSPEDKKKLAQWLPDTEVKF
ncbi:MAG: leucine-rich repeat domain-containing protein [bacterium]|nr:leucine-rich repeat domain-containing protein [bacterium]